jgi:hypothetical protein
MTASWKCVYQCSLIADHDSLIDASVRMHEKNVSFLNGLPIEVSVNLKTDGNEENGIKMCCDTDHDSINSSNTAKKSRHECM